MANAFRLYRAVVVSTVDPDGLGRVRLASTRTARGAAVQDEGWAAVGAIPLGASVSARPAYAAGDTVLYAAERLPFVGAVLICLAGGAAATTAPANLLMRISLGQGNEATLAAADGALRLSTTAGQQVSLLASGAIDVVCATEISVSAAQCKVTAAMVAVDAGMARFSGVVQCDTLIATSVIATSYTPGAGNIA